MNGSAAAAAAAKPNVDSVLLTRDCTHFRVVKSPVAAIARRLFAALASDEAGSSKIRRCFAHAILDRPLMRDDDDYTDALDAQIKEAFSSHPPTVCLVQGPFKVDFILDPNGGGATPPGTPGSVSTLASSFSSLSTTTSPLAGNAPDKLEDAIFLGFTLHNELLRCQREDKEHAARLSYFTLATLVHESAHWLYTRTHGFRPDAERESFRSRGQAGSAMSATLSKSMSSQSGSRAEEPLVALGARADDSGRRAVEQLLGATSKTVSFADGDTEVVKRNILPPISSGPPALTGPALEGILGAKLPTMLDVTGHSPVIIGGPPPKWSTHDTYLVTSQVAANSFCSHGDCRIQLPA